MFNVACELSQTMGKTEFSSTAKNRANSVSLVRKVEFTWLYMLHGTGVMQHVSLCKHTKNHVSRHESVASNMPDRLDKIDYFRSGWISFLVAANESDELENFFVHWSKKSFNSHINRCLSDHKTFS